MTSCEPAARHRCQLEWQPGRDDFSGYKQCFDMGVTEVDCMAHARRKFHEICVYHQSKVGE